MKNILRKILKSYILLFLVLIIVAIIILPLLLTQKFIIENTTQQINIEVKKEEIDYNVKYKTINLLHKVDNTSEDIELDEYIVNVVAAEMPVDYELEALKA